MNLTEFLKRLKEYKGRFVIGNDGIIITTKNKYAVRNSRFWITICPIEVFEVTKNASAHSLFNLKI